MLRDPLVFTLLLVFELAVLFIELGPLRLNDMVLIALDLLRRTFTGSLSLVDFAVMTRLFESACELGFDESVACVEKFWSRSTAWCCCCLSNRRLPVVVDDDSGGGGCGATASSMLHDI